MPSRIFTLSLIMALMFVATLITHAEPACAQTQSGTPQKAARYVCPMHKDVTATKPGVCPKCGMALRLTADTPDAEAKPAGTNPNPMTDDPSDVASLKVPDIKVYDQYGKPKNFYTDLVKGKTVAVNFIFTTCTTICPPLTATFRQVQQELDKGKLDVQLISVSVDPSTDTSERLLAFAGKFKAGPGWTFVTGDQAGIDSLLKALGAAVADKNDHSPMVLIGNEKTGYWTRAFGLSSPESLVKIITQAANQK